MRRIAGGLELWFERPGFPPSRCTAQAAMPVAKCRAQRAAPNIMPCGGRQQGPEPGRFLVEGAHGTMLVLQRLVAFIITTGTVLGVGPALAAIAGQPEPWQLGLQKGATPVMDDIIWFHDFLLWVISAIALFVLVLLIAVMVKFNARSNPVPSRTTHNTFIEVLW